MSIKEYSLKKREINYLIICMEMLPFIFKENIINIY